jgi:hypothetical protein
MQSKVLVRGLIAGAAGVAAMTLSEKMEQMLTRRPNSYVPAHTMQRLLGKREEDCVSMNWAMHWGQGVLFGAIRGLMAEHGLRGPMGSFLFMNLRLLNDQTWENVTGAGAPPWTWPVDEQAIDLVHKFVYAFVAGQVADRLIAGPAGVPEPRKPWAER